MGAVPGLSSRKKRLTSCDNGPGRGSGKREAGGGRRDSGEHEEMTARVTRHKIARAGPAGAVCRVQVHTAVY